MEILTTQVSQRRWTSWSSGPEPEPEPAYPLGPRFAGPRQGLAGGSAPSTPPPTIALLRSAREAGSRPFPRCRRGLMADRRISRRARGLARGREALRMGQKMGGDGVPAELDL